jgi:hypothetical protein
MILKSPEAFLEGFIIELLKIKILGLLLFVASQSNEYGRPLSMWSTVPCKALFSTGLSFIQRRRINVVCELVVV